ncbi:MAG: nitronate monooxygenase [Oscillospiraceae bacterium]|nr:nitronate monooxygenase [Oscillospiraceae bacterium]
MGRKLKTRITEMLGIERPILSGAMQWLAKAELVAAVSNAGGLGVMSSATFPTADLLREEIRKCRNLTDKPFGVNLTLMPSLAPPDYPAYVRVCAEEGIRIMETSGRLPDKFLPAMKDCGMTVIHKCTVVRHALKAQSIGCDAVIMDGCEAAGHVGENDIGSMVLWPAAVDALEIPVIACGGVADGRGLAAALMLGCEGATVGTRFFLTEEAPALAAGKQMVAEHVDETGTMLLLRRFTNTTRVLNNGLAVKVRELEESGADFSELAPLVSGRRLKTAFETGNLEEGILTIGQSAGLIHDVSTIPEAMDRMMEECFAALERVRQTEV